MDFSIIIPAKNEQGYLPACLDSLAQLDYPPSGYEVLVIDNGSTDDTVAIARQYGAQVFVRPELTIAGLRNFGANNAQGRFLVFLDADCTVAPNWLTAASVWLDQPDVCCFGNPPEIPEQSTWVQKAWCFVRRKREMIEEAEWLESAHMFIRQEAFDRVRGFDETLATCEDYDLSLRLKKHGRIITDKGINVIHHRDPATINHFFQKECWRGLSNLSGLTSHGLHLRELPSLLLPFIYVFCLVATVAALVATIAIGSGEPLKCFLALLFMWQLPIFLLAMLKNRTSGTFQLRLGLYVLLNVYFLARGIAMLRGWRR